MASHVLQLLAHIHPTKLARDDSEQVASVRLDIDAPSDAPVRPLNLALLIDKSSSMGGQKIETAKAASAEAVRRLSDGDSITLVAFNHNAELIVPAVQVGKNRSRPLDSIKSIRSGGGTNIGAALQMALDQLTAQAQPGRVNSILLVTDGQDGAKPQTKEIAPKCTSSGIRLYSAGIGNDYDHEFLAEICTTKDRVDDITQAEQMVGFFQKFLEKEGRLVSANGKLRITPADGVRLSRLTSFEDRGENLSLDAASSLDIRDLYAGKSLQYFAEFIVVPASLGSNDLAAFQIEYDIPSAGVKGQRTEVRASYDVTDDPSQANSPNPNVVQISRKLQTARLAEKAEQDLTKKDVRGATEKLKRVTKKLEDLGEVEKANEMRERTAALEKAADLDVEIKRLRGTTKRLTQD